MDCFIFMFILVLYSVLFWLSGFGIRVPAFIDRVFLWHFINSLNTDCIQDVCMYVCIHVIFFLTTNVVSVLMEFLLLSK
jgi:hypothetical protein